MKKRYVYSILFGDYCSKLDYPTSSLSLRDSDEMICSCIDNSGKVVIKIPLESIELVDKEGI